MVEPTIIMNACEGFQDSNMMQITGSVVFNTMKIKYFNSNSPWRWRLELTTAWWINPGAEENISDRQVSDHVIVPPSTLAGLWPVPFCSSACVYFLFVFCVSVVLYNAPLFLCVHLFSYMVTSFLQQGIRLYRVEACWYISDTLFSQEINST